MSEMIERVQEAIRKEIGTRHHGLPKGGWDGLMKQAARVAIEAMRDPTVSLLYAGSAQHADLPFHQTAEIWQAMIDEALK